MPLLPARLQALERRLHALSPYQVLRRGFSITRTSDRLYQDWIRLLNAVGG